MPPGRVQAARVAVVRISARGRSPVLALAAALVVIGCGGTRDAEIIDATLSADELTLGLTVGACNGDNRATVIEDSDNVRVRVETSDPSGDECADGLEIKLESPMGDRFLIDDTTGDKVDFTRTP
jgi:hypothetical protein